jgi:tRNA U34 5-methylaminomethyl-2-thiouridine-forming methyltransferase MnmC
MHSSELFFTEDGSHSIFSTKYKVPYHSRHGAIIETKHVFIEAGLKPMLQKKALGVLDIGFGTGLNAFMSLLESNKNSSSIYYEAIEAYPLQKEVVNQFNYAQELHAKQETFIQLHTTEWNKEHSLTDKFTFKKQLNTFEEFTSSNYFDVIYYDAFAPSAQPTLWETGLLAKMYSLLNPNGVLVTYCAQGQFKRNLKAVGFSIEPLPGPPGKREMTRARKG